MSHYTLLVVGPTDDKEIEEALAPFYEEREVEPYIEYTLEDIDKEQQEKIENDERIIAAGGNEKQIEELTKELKKIKKMTPKWFAFYWYGHKTKQDKDGNILTTYNPDSQWDWYQLGGRWIGYFRLKKSKRGQLGTPSFGVTSTEEQLERHADRALVKDIDFEGMRNLRAKEAEEKAKKVDTFIKEKEKEDKITEAEAIEKYESYIDAELGIEVGKSREDYMREKSFISTFAVLKDGNWYERGEMGWFCSIIEGTDRAEWEQEFGKLMKSLDGNTMLNVVDCHI